MGATSRTNWWWSDWRADPGVRRLTPAERGLWIDMLSLMVEGNPAGYLCDFEGKPIPNAELARFSNSTPRRVAKLIAGILGKGVASRDDVGIFNRRIVRQMRVNSAVKIAHLRAVAKRRFSNDVKTVTRFRTATSLESLS